MRLPIVDSARGKLRSGDKGGDSAGGVGTGGANGGVLTAPANLGSILIEDLATGGHGSVGANGNFVEKRIVFKISGEGFEWNGDFLIGSIVGRRGEGGSVGSVVGEIVEGNTLN